MTEPIAPVVPCANCPARAPSKFHKAVHAAIEAAISPEAQKLEFALGRYIVYTVLAAIGYKHASILGL